MKDLTDLEITRLCAEAMGLEHQVRQRQGMDIGADVYSHGEVYDPLHNDEQAMALVKKLTLEIWWDKTCEEWVCDTRLDVKASGRGAFYDTHGLNRAVCECVARMQLSKAGKNAKEEESQDLRSTEERARSRLLDLGAPEGCR